MNFPVCELASKNIPPLLFQIPEPPTTVTYRGAVPPKEIKLLSIVGSRKYTTYGKEVVEHLVSGLKKYPVGIVSGMALGVDSLAHEEALRNNLYTLAIPGGGLNDNVLYPAQHKRLAHRILESGGGLLSEFEPDFKATAWSFPKRNRLVAGISHATLLIEAGEKSGTLITARLTVDYNRELLVVPGSIFSKNSYGIHQFLKLGATPVTEAKDILEVLGIEEIKKEEGETASRPPLPQLEKTVLSFLHEPQPKDEIIRKLNLPTSEANMLLMQMEISGYIVESNGLYRAVI